MTSFAWLLSDYKEAWSSNGYSIDCRDTVYTNPNTHGQLRCGIGANDKVLYVFNNVYTHTFMITVYFGQNTAW